MDEKLQKASFEKRLGAFVIDHIIFSVILVVGFLIFSWNAIQNEPEKLLFLFSVFLLAAFLLYCLKDIFRGVSLGKWAVGLAVRDKNDNGSVPKPQKLFIRNILTFFWPIELLVLLCSKEKRKLGDNFAGTDVYSTSKAKPAAIITISIMTGIIGLAFFAGSLLFGVTAIMKNDDSYKTAIAYIENDEEILNIAGDINGYGFFVMGSVYHTGMGDEKYGDADLTIKVIGSKKTLYVNVVLEKERGKPWTIKECVPLP